ncbi:heavy-metal-associated domain-containing protein [Candidatus Nitrospira inopinata]|jgi:copper chaperone CopZ|uniref:Putative Mercuric transport protein periplasmic component n=1 Tax=Candidatus Nitrospira inopinata TaxID=1715989 RepID=A0A0S4KPW2_9BACT|nr:heavy-metal-associated domain-containing protein [Candidatus Nitrospira inopinata]CUQ65369.1 putative Mercuric transport protein periplasmic component [Candidatus Nitrospira inopinata]
MKRIVTAIIATGVLLGVLELAQAAEQRITLMLGGSYCDLYLGEVESAVKKVSGVKAVDFKSMKGHAVVTVEGDKTTSKQLVEAVNNVKGDGWHCHAKVMK